MYYSQTGCSLASNIAILMCKWLGGLCNRFDKLPVEFIVPILQRFVSDSFVHRWYMLVYLVVRICCGRRVKKTGHSTKHGLRESVD